MIGDRIMLDDGTFGDQWEIREEILPDGSCRVEHIETHEERIVWRTSTGRYVLARPQQEHL